MCWAGRLPAIKTFFFEISETTKLPIEEVTAIQKYAQVPISLDLPVGDEGNSELGDFIEDKTFKSQDAQAMENLLRDDLFSAMDILTEREQTILKLRFGLDDGRPRTLEEVGAVYNVTRERIRQIEEKALTKLRHPSRKKRLEAYRQK